jgi:probable F420-dependent oxidoreductase
VATLTLCGGTARDDGFWTRSAIDDESEFVMQFALLPPVSARVLVDPEWMASFASHADACGYESVVMVEHAVIVSGYESKYPYARSGRMPLPDDCPIPDPLDLMAYLAAATDRITLATGVLVLPNHHPVVLAKRIATVDVLSKGRVRMCMGVGWMNEEIAASGADPRTKGRRVDECIAALRVLWADAGPGGADFEGEFFSFHHAHSFPKPAQPGGVPIHIGGHSDAAARRAGRLGDGFQPLGLDAELVTAKMQVVRESAEEAGRDPAAIELSLSGYIPTTTEEEIESNAALGATRMVVSTSLTSDLGQVKDELSAFAERFGVSAGAGAGAPPARA